MSSKKYRPKRSPNNFFVKMNTGLSPWKKEEQKFVLLLSFSNELPKVDNRPIGETSPNLVTLNCRLPKLKIAK
jgi:hypothetical protein